MVPFIANVSKFANRLRIFDLGQKRTLFKEQSSN